ncbi:MAG TPA: LamG-like jellyroll fold domain-containing protein, partial [Lacipirellulaceae bacterium]|nr:LamG-like jellyroll fold domain-containing protein [Lacipirellulaceae bacterium]
LFSYAVTGQVYAQPLYVSNLNMGALGTHNVIFVATENNDVYAFDADNNGAGGGLLWHLNLGKAAAVPNAYFGNIGGPNSYGDIKPQIGITSTPVIDLDTNTMYLDSFTNPSTGVYEHHIWALDITSGAQKTAPQLVAAAIQGNSPADSVGGVIAFNSTQQLQRTALTLLNGVVYASYAGYGDTPPYHGWILGFSTSDLSLVSVFNDTPNLTLPEDPRESAGGGIWQGGGGLASDGTHLWFMTGNGDFDATVGDYGDSFVELTPDNSTQNGPNPNKNGYGLSVTDYFTPYNEQTLSNNDTDLGSGGPLLLPTQSGLIPNEMVGVGKQSLVYLVNRDDMGGFSSTSDNVVQEVSLAGHATSSMAYFDNMIYSNAFSDVLKAFKVTNGTLSNGPIASGSTSFAFPGATPSISSYGSSANGIVWEVQYTNSTSTAILRAFDAIPNGTSLTQIYSSNDAAGNRDQLGTNVKFVSPTIANGHVYVGTSGAVTVFGLLANPTTAPAAPTDLTATASVALGLQIQLDWTDHANNENAFKIERSDDGGAFVQIDVASVNATNYVDTNLVSGHTYAYRVSATNPVGDSGYTNTTSTTIVATPAVYHYDFDDGSGTFASDSAGTNTGVLVGAAKPEWVAGRLGLSALSFSGNGQYNQTGQSAVQVSSNLVSPLAGTSTFSAWVKTSQIGNNNHQQAPALTGVDQLGSTGDINWGTLNAAGEIGIYVGDSGGVYSTTPINDGQWHNVTMTRNAFTGVVQLYIDGTLNNTGSLDIGYKPAQFYLLGALTVRNSSGNVVGANYFNGQIDDVQIYDRVLGADEITEMGAAPTAPTNLVVSAVPDSGSMLQLTWTNTASLAQNVTIERKIGIDGTYEPLASVGGSDVIYTDTNLDSGTPYFYRLQASGAAGTSDYSNEASATPPLPHILGEYLFYNQSEFDGRNGNSNIVDGFALAPDKVPLKPGQTASFQNYSSYSNGLNGVAIDITNWDGSITPDDYTFLVGNSNDLSSWQPAPEPVLVTQYPGFGVGGSIRLEVVWDNNAIQNEWVQVTLKADGNTLLPADEVFYFGNAIGETGNSSTDAVVDAADVQGTHDHYTSAAIITNAYDFNRDKVVDATDESIAAASESNGSALLLISVPDIHGGDAVDDELLSAGPILASSSLSEKIANDSVEPAATAKSVDSVLSLMSSAPTIDRSHSIDAVFDAFAQVVDGGNTASRLLELESVHHRVVPNSTDDVEHWHSTDSLTNEDAQPADDLLATAFEQVRFVANLTFSLQ